MGCKWPPEAQRGNSFRQKLCPELTADGKGASVSCRGSYSEYGVQVASLASKFGQVIVELDLHTNRAERFDEMRLFGKDQPRTAWLEDRLGVWLEHLIAQLPIKHADNTSRPSLGTMFAAQSSWNRHFIEYWRGFIECRC